MAGKSIDFFWDAGSTNTYFAWHLLKPLAHRFDATIRCRPFNLGYVFRHHNYVLADEPATKLRNRRRDLMRWAERYDLAFRMPDEFPIKTSRALRGSLVMREHGLEAAYIDAIFERYWERNDASIATYEGLRAVARSLGVDPETFEDRCESAAIREALIDETNQALEDGVFGAPSMRVDGELYWGKDRMEFIETALAT